MSIWDTLEDLLSLHDRTGALIALVQTAALLERASRYNPRSSDDWDLLEMRDDRMRGILREMQRMRDRTNRMGRADTAVPNESAEIRSLFGAWVETYARHGPEARQTTAAQQALEVAMMNWLNALTALTSYTRTTRPRIERHREFYVRQQDLFRTLQQLATRYVEYWPASSGRAKALAYMIDFERAAGLCQNIVRNYDGAITALGRVETDVRTATAEAGAWARWYANRSAAVRDVAAGRQPRGT